MTPSVHEHAPLPPAGHFATGYVPADVGHAAIDAYDERLAQAFAVDTARQRLGELAARAGALQRFGRWFTGKPDIAGVWMRKEGFANAKAAREHYAEQLDTFGEAGLPGDETIAQAVITEVRHFFGRIPESAAEQIKARTDNLCIPKLFKHWKDGDEAENGMAARSWPSWLADGETGASDEQLLSVLRWDKHRVEGLARTRQGVIGARLVRFETALKRAVSNGQLNGQLIQRTRERGVAVTFAGAFDHSFASGAGAYHPKGTDVIVFGEGPVSEPALAHQRTHMLGGFAHPLLDEAATEYISRTALQANDHAGQYQERVICVAEMLELAGLTANDLSLFYSGTNANENKRQFATLVAERTGIDVVTIVTKAFDAEMRQRATSEYASRMAHTALTNVTIGINAVLRGTFDETYRQTRNYQRSNGQHEAKLALMDYIRNHKSRIRGAWQTRQRP